MSSFVVHKDVEELTQRLLAEGRESRVVKAQQQLIAQQAARIEELERDKHNFKQTALAYREAADTKTLRIQELEKDAARLVALIELAGTWHDGSDSMVSIGSDDALRQYVVSVGYARNRKYYSGYTMRSAIDSALRQQAESKEGV